MQQASPFRRRSFFDGVVTEVDNAMRVLSGSITASRPNPAGPAPVAIEAAAEAPGELSPYEARHAAGLMRVNHVGEICAQALYRAQAMVSKQPATREMLLDAAAEEVDHLAWCAERLKELGSRPSLLNPLWYAGAFSLGLLAGRAGDAINLGFMAETEKQVEEHLHGHLSSLPAQDARSRRIVEQMSEDEREHRYTAVSHGGKPLLAPVRGAMRVASKVMTSSAYYL